MDEQLIGVVSNYFGNISVAAFEITNGKLKIGDHIHLKGHTTDFSVKVESMQSENNTIELAQKGDDIGIKVNQKVRTGDKVYLINKD
mgnify:CR=1 FL=1